MSETMLVRSPDLWLGREFPGSRIVVVDNHAAVGVATLWYLMPLYPGINTVLMGLSYLKGLSYLNGLPKRVN